MYNLKTETIFENCAQEVCSVCLAKAFILCKQFEKKIQQLGWAKYHFLI